MKQLFLFLLVAFVSYNGFSQATEKAAIPVPVQAEKVNVQKNAVNTAAPKVEEVVERTNAKMTFETMMVEYGTIQQKSEPLRTVKFTNTGTDPLIIKSAQGSCGCTVPVWPKDPILPGQSSVIEVRYDTNRVGKINKSITITTNEGPEKHILQVVGEVLKVEEEMVVPAPAPSVIKG
ncbi:MAG: DUF1573 domain-containing protein [Saprospiraceae bacterium]|nr:DUF1573 domain-containing protein [Saprospiraceae bacterium]